MVSKCLQKCGVGLRAFFRFTWVCKRLCDYVSERFRGVEVLRVSDQARKFPSGGGSSRCERLAWGFHARGGSMRV